MLGHLVRKEILDHLLSPRYLILMACGAFIIWLSLYSGYAYYSDRVTDDRIAKVRTEERIRQMDASEDLTEFVSIGFPEHKPPTALSIFVRGQEPVLGRTIDNHMTIGTRRLMRSPQEVDPLLGVFPPLDFASVTQLVLSLFVIILTFDSVCGEKERGTLALVASFSLPRHRLLLGKLVGALIPVLIAFGLPLMLGLAVLLILPGVQLTDMEIVRLAFICLAFVVYLGAFTCLGLFGSTVTYRASTSFVILLGFWVIAVVMVPRLSLIAADGLRPAISTYELEANKASVAKANMEKARSAIMNWEQAYGDSTGRPWYVSSEGHEARERFQRWAWDELSGKTSAVQHAHLEREFLNRYDTRLELAVAMATLSPAFAFSDATGRLAGSGLERQRRFRAAFDAFREEYVEWYGRMSSKVTLQRTNPEKHGEFRWDISDMPRLLYRETWPDEEIQAAMVHM
jgi:ABC-type transport system involved in multi-copper enzyme maturation permease subunit